MTRKIKFGVMGCANIADRMVIPAIICNPGCQLDYVSSRNKTKAEKFADRFSCDFRVGYHQLLKEDIDAVYIPLPNGLHYDWALKSIEAGKHLLIEKSVACNLAEVEEIIEKARAKNVLVMENFQFQYHSQHQRVKEIINEGEIGNIRCFRSSFGFPPFRDSDNIRYNKALGGGALLDAGAYTLKATTFVMGGGFNVAAASLSYQPSFDVDIFGGGMLVNSDGITSQVAFGFDQYYQCNYEVWGSEGKLISDRAFTASPGIMPKIIVEKQNERHEYIMPQDNHFSNLLSEFTKRINEGDFEKEYQSVLEQARLIDEFKNISSGE